MLNPMIHKVLPQENHAETMHKNHHNQCQCISLDQDYDPAFVHLVRELNMEVDGLSHLEMTSTIPQHVLNNIYAVDNLDHNNNYGITLAMSLVKTE